MPTNTPGRRDFPTTDNPEQDYSQLADQIRGAMRELNVAAGMLTQKILDAGRDSQARGEIEAVYPELSAAYKRLLEDTYKSGPTVKDLEDLLTRIKNFIPQMRAASEAELPTIEENK